MAQLSILQTSLPRNINILEFIYAFLLLIPGFLSYKVSVWRSANRYATRDFEEVGWSLLGSGVSLSIFYICYLFYIDIGNGQNELVLGSQINLAILAPAYLFILVIAIALGFAAGWGHDNILNRGKGLKTGRAWDKFNILLVKRREQFGKPRVRVVTTDNEIFEGYINYSGAGNDIEPADLLFRSNRHIDKDGNEIEKQKWRYLYFPEDKIARIDTKVDLYWHERS